MGAVQFGELWVHRIGEPHADAAGTKYHTQQVFHVRLAAYKFRKKTHPMNNRSIGLAIETMGKQKID